ncbi:hypothetical protein A2524_01405 [Candidatus Wolfebacteria bacterium RIFOXYD12_FULL_48_21]|uniref:GP-PDE domain-containing protein n=1 Tax=Candidatus Wolfebacteria bacterium RIFOXYD1_FULL_48_65 TaxID=1802561 RepID=A0A1F8DZ09_9BACT|nr:MAG: hypothetical protein A2610_00590 [Candidatus Wolfebacteria bacterium RIFOXYD1_FULL_48_65]OGM94463.1 MAG: hypothetical protein A2524_01405 [Candidatus Wolfebacteria bacterium RIFOXYD12_FULL_48_21]OGM97931.1 MAG: hypothetical protein A2532_04315 [Candidatus Wolfebacteria bacterium RIFOXYD2_FULL_48_11]
MVLRLGHRGACGYAPENTVASFVKAIELNVAMIELDVRLCKSGEVMVLHDEKVDRMTNGHGAVSDLTLEELRQLDIKDGGKIPTLAEAFDAIDRKARVVIELKHAEVVEPTAALVRSYIAERGWGADDFLPTAFDHYFLARFRELVPGIGLAAILAGVPIGYAEFGERLGAYSVNMAFPFLNKEFVEDAHRRGLKVFAWTVNEPEDIAWVKALGVDGIFSNFPDRV